MSELTGEIIGDEEPAETAGGPEKIEPAKAGVKKRGRPPISDKAAGLGESPLKTKGGKIKSDRKKLAAGLAAAHAIAAKMTGQPALTLDDARGEPEKLADAIGEILDYYSVAVNPVMVMWANLAFVAGSIYIPRAAIIAASKPKAPPMTAKPETARNPNPRQSPGVYTPNPGQFYDDGTGGLIQ